MSALQTPRGNLELVPTAAPATTPEYDWPSSPLFELWALRIRIDARCRQGEAREGWVSCRVLRKTMG